MRVGIDVDGVLADFNGSYIPLVKELTGVQLPPVSDTYPDTGNYDKAAGMTGEQIHSVWQAIAATPTFLIKMRPLEESVAMLHKLGHVETAHHFYFITSRVGPHAKFATEAWLMRWFHLPTVLIASEKGPIAKSLGLELFVDDKPENVNEVVEATEGKCLVLMPERPWNRNAIVDARVVRVKNLEKTLAPVLGFVQDGLAVAA